MKKLTYITLGIIGGLLALILFLFLSHCHKTDFNQALLGEFDGEFIYLRRDKDSTLKLYKSDATLQKETLLYEHSSDVNSNIINVNSVDDKILFDAYNDESNTFETYELDLKTSKATVSDQHENLKYPTHILTGTLNGEEYKVLAEDGSIYLSFSDRKVVVEKFNGMYDSKFSPGFTPVSLSEDGMYLFYTASRHATPFGVFLQEVFLDSSSTMTYVINLETLEKSQFIDFSSTLVIVE